MPRPPSDKTKPRKSRATGKAKADPDRNADGTVAKGNKAAKGHGKGRTGRQTLAEETRYMQAIRQGLPPERLSEVIEAVVKEALGGNIKAAELLLKYVVGKPVEYKPPDADKPTAIEITWVRAQPGGKNANG